MKRILNVVALLATFASPALAADYMSFSLTTTANVTPEKAWSRIGDFCAIKDWLGTTCSISVGSGEVGTTRLLNNGAVTEMMVAKTPFSYTYMQPLNPANLYHGTLQVEPDGAGHSKIVYTFLYDQELLGTDEAKAAGRKQRTDRFTAALAKMKAMAEAP
jgi:Polyketide cyclase / dehydrase and lipid transport